MKTPQTTKRPSFRDYEDTRTILKPGQHIFAYKRKSTKKDEQAESLEKQNDSIERIVADMGLTMDDITESFEDAFTGYKIKTRNGTPQVKRPGFKALVERIKQEKTPCILLAFNPSRLTRNMPDGTTIREFLGHYENKQKIEYIRFYNGMVWDKHTLGTTIDAEVTKASSYSERLSEDKRDNNLVALSGKIMPKTIKTPPGLKATPKGMEETEAMPYIRKAFEMKAEGRQGKDISEYLLKKGIKIKEGNLMTMLWSKTQYIGHYTHPKMGEVFENLKFTKGEPPISLTLWDNVQRRIGRKVGRNRGAYKDDILASRLRWLEDIEKFYTFSPYLKKGKLKNYKSNAFAGFNKSEYIIINTILEYLRLRLESFYQEKFGKELKHIDNRECEIYINIGKFYIDILRQKYPHLGREAGVYSDNRLFEIGSAQFFHWNSGDYEEDGFYCFPFKEDWEKAEYQYSSKEEGTSGSKKVFDSLISKEIQLWEKKNTELVSVWETLNRYKKKGLKGECYILFASLIKQYSPQEVKETEEIRKKELIEALERKEDIIRKKKEKRGKMTLALGVSDTMTQEDYEVAIEMIESNAKQELDSLEKTIEELSKGSDIEQFMYRLPEVLGKIFELSSKVLSSEEIEGMKDEIYKLIELTVFELPVNNKKELIVKLFEGLDDLGNLNGGRYRIRTYDPLRVKQVL